MKTFIWSMYAETLALAGGLAALSKALIRRNRPYVYKPFSKADKDSFSAHHSFFSGHETNSAALSFLTAYLVSHYTRSPRWKWGAWMGAFTISAAMGYLRYASGNHYLSDILVGSAVGAGTGIIVPFAHQHSFS